MDRCYSNGLPDGEEVPDQLIDNNRVPCYKKVAIAILNNDHNLKSLGFESKNWNQSLIDQLEDMQSSSDNLSLF